MTNHSVDRGAAFLDKHAATLPECDVARRLELQAQEETAQVAPALHSPPSSSEQTGDLAREVASLAMLSPLEYDRVRLEAAKRLSVRNSTLDAEVKKARASAAGGEISSLVEHTSPFEHPVVVREVLDELRAVFHRHAVLPPHADVALTLWTAFTWFIEAAQIAPLLIIRAPETECGKTTVKDIIEQFVRRPLSSEGISGAALFRVVEQEQPTLLLDDADSWLLRDPNDERHSLINSGHKRGGKVLRCTGENFELRAFSTFCAKVIVFIGKSKDTLHNRSIEVVLRRKLPSETIIQLRQADRGEFSTLRAKLARMEADHIHEFATQRPRLDGLDNRAADNWEPLFSIAELAGGEWPDLARNAARALLAMRDTVVSAGLQLLWDIQQVYATRGEEKMRTKDLISALCEDEEAPWATYSRGDTISPKQVSKLLGAFGIHSKSLHFGYGNKPKGYDRSDFQEAFLRYPPPCHESIPSAATPRPPRFVASPQVADESKVADTFHGPATSEAVPALMDSQVAAQRPEPAECDDTEVDL